MSFASTAHIYTLHDLAQWTLISAEVEAADGGWDTGEITLAKHLGTTTDPTDVLAEWPRGRNLSRWTGNLGTMVVARARARPTGGGVWQVDLSAQGIIMPRVRRARGGVSQSFASAEGIAIPGLGVADRANISEVTPGFEVDYISSTRPLTELVGTAGTPLNPPAVRPPVWSGLANPTLNWPNGWILADMQYEQLLDLPLWLITETWEYQFALSP